MFGLILALATVAPSATETRCFYKGMEIECPDDGWKCDLTEVLLAARAVEPLVHLTTEGDWLSRWVCPLESFEAMTVAEHQCMARVHSEIAAYDAAIARLRRALAACAPGPSVPNDDGDQKNPIQPDPPRKNQQKPVKP